MGRRRAFTREFKLEAVRLIQERGVSAAQASRDLGVHENVLRKWVRDIEADPKQAFPGTDPTWFPERDLVHLDMYTDNLLAAEDGALSGIIDWEGVCAGDCRFDLDGHDQPIWEVVEDSGIELRVLRASVALQALTCTSWQILHNTPDEPRQLARGRTGRRSLPSLTNVRSRTR